MRNLYRKSVRKYAIENEKYFDGVHVRRAENFAEVSGLCSNACRGRMWSSLVKQRLYISKRLKVSWRKKRYLPSGTNFFLAVIFLYFQLHFFSDYSEQSQAHIKIFITALCSLHVIWTLTIARTHTHRLKHWAWHSTKHLIFLYITSVIHKHVHHPH